VSHASALLLVEQPTEAQLREGFLDLLDALLAVAPQTRTAAVLSDKLTRARGMIEAGSIVEPKAVALLGQCYRETHEGRDFAMPASVHTIADARGYIGRQLAAAPELLQAGRNDEAAQRLLEAVVAIVTPMHR